jgi:replicative DNA helicase
MSEDLFAKVPPQSLDAELSVLGAMLLDKEAIFKAMEILEPTFFYKEAHRKIYEAILSLHDKDEPVDLVTLTEELKRRGELEEVGGLTYLSTILETVPTSAHIEHYAKIVMEKALLRKLIDAATRIITLCYNEQSNVETLLDRAEQLVFDVVQRKITRGFVNIVELIHESFEAIEALYSKKEEVTGIPTGFKEFDILTSGFHPSELVIIAGRPSMGKSSFCLNIAQYVGTKKKMPVGIFSLEMSREQVVQRLLCAEARVDAHKLRTGYLSESDWPRLTAAASLLSESPIFIDDTPAVSILEVRAKARRLKAKHDIKLFIIDYLQLLQGRGESENRQQEISEITRSLKSLARELNVPIIALSQLSRAVETRSDRRPQLSDLRESGAIEQDADLVAFVYREEYYKPTAENEGVAEIIVGKQRNGPVGTVKLAFVKKYARFENLAR